MKKILIFLALTLLLGACFPKAKAAPPPAPTVTPIPPTPTPGIGDTRSRDIDGATMLYIPAATFEMGIEAGEKGNPAHLVSLDSYWIDKTEVTNRAFASFLNSFEGLTPASASQWFNAWIENSRLAFADGQWTVVEGFEDYPVTTVNWLGAQAYCQWAGARLPSEAEWELAARGTEGELNPTGLGITCEQANICTEEPYPTGSFTGDVSPYGVQDLGGNVMEWVSDWYHPYYFESETTSNPKGPMSGSNKVLRGGFFLTSMPAYDRLEISPSYSDPGTGLRCAKSSQAESPQIPPQVYAVEYCMQGTNAEGQPAPAECVVGVSKLEDGQVQVNFIWNVSSDECSANNNDAGTANMYIVDDLGDRYDSIDHINYAGTTCVKNSVSHFIFPKVNDQAGWIVFYDDNLGASTNPIPLLWANPVISEVQPSFAPTPRPLSERFSQVNTFASDAAVENLAWSADGRSLLVKSMNGVAVYDAVSGYPWPALSAGGMHVAATDGAWSPDGSRLAVTDGVDIFMFDALGATFYYSLIPPAAVNQMVFSPDGKTLAAVLSDGTVRLLNVSAAQISRTINEFNEVSYIAWSQDGDKLAVQAADGFHLIRPADSQILAHWDYMLTPAWSPDSTMIAGYFQQQVILQNVVSGEREIADSPVFSPSQVAPLVDWSPNGKYFVTANQTAITFWSAEDRLRQIASLSGHSTDVMSLAFSPDGSYLASGSADGNVILWNIAGE